MKSDNVSIVTKIYYPFLLPDVDGTRRNYGQELLQVMSDAAEKYLKENFPKEENPWFPGRKEHGCSIKTSIVRYTRSEQEVKPIDIWF